MSEQLPEPRNEGHPIIAGLVALVGVAVVVGLVLGVAALAGTRVAGLGEDDGSTGTSAERSLFVPRPEKTPKQTEPEITLAPSGGGATPNGTATKDPTQSASPRKQITLSASAAMVAPMERLDLTGVYAGGEGAILRVERFASGSWQDFGVTVSVSDETFSTYIQTGVAGVNRFRVVDTDSDLESNEVRVTIG